MSICGFPASSATHKRQHCARRRWMSESFKWKISISTASPGKWLRPIALSSPSRARAPSWHDGFLEMCRRAGFEPKISGTADDPITARIMIGSGAGATFFHDKGGNDSNGEITLLHFSDNQTMPPSQTALAWADVPRTRQIEEFIACLASAHDAWLRGSRPS